ncbi:FbpB family small basic protein [Bacillus sp. M6-12]|nr:FbpB family small basic protein [Bacillus sp. M6-12]
MRMSFAELIKKNKDELLKDRAQLEKIEKRIDDKHVKAKN